MGRNFKKGKKERKKEKKMKTEYTLLHAGMYY